MKPRHVGSENSPSSPLSSSIDSHVFAKASVQSRPLTLLRRFSSWLSTPVAVAASPPSPTSSSPSCFVVVLDLLAVITGIVCVFLILSTMTSDVNAVDNGAMGTATDVNNYSSAFSSLNSRLIPGVKKELHSMLDGSVGKHLLLKALRERSSRRQLVKQRAATVVASDDLTLAPKSSTSIDGEADSESPSVGAFDLASAPIADARPLTPLLLNPDERSILDDDATYFVAVCQFRDLLCPRTIEELYGQARNPRRVFTGIVDQREKQTHHPKYPVGKSLPLREVKNFSLVPGIDFTCVPWYQMKTCATTDFCWTDNIRVRHSWPKDSMGPTWGRYYAGLMYQGEQYYMSIDSHSRFVKHWDAQIVLNLLLVPKTTKKAVLTHYPSGFQQYKQLLSHRTTTHLMMMCNSRFVDTGIIRMTSLGFETPGFPAMQPFSAGGFIVGDASFVHEVPFDPYLDYVFDGEEVLYAARLWTHGYDLFTPRNTILFHHYARHHAPRFWGYRKAGMAQRKVLGQSRVKYFMKSMAKVVSNRTMHTSNRSAISNRMVSDKQAKAQHLDIEEDIYGLGKVRTIEDYYRFAGVNTTHWKHPMTFCQNITMGFGPHVHKYNRVHLARRRRAEKVQKVVPNKIEMDEMSDFEKRKNAQKKIKSKKVT